MKGVTIKMCKYFMQVIKQNQLPYLLNDEKEIFDRVYRLIMKNKLYNDVGNTIEKEANRIVNEECKPKWEALGKEMEELNKQIEELNKAEEKDNEKIEELSKQISEKSSEIEKIGTEANAKLNEFKDNLIDTEYKTTYCFDLHNNEYDLVNRVIWWSVYDWQTEGNIVAPK